MAALATSKEQKTSPALSDVYSKAGRHMSGRKQYLEAGVLQAQVHGRGDGHDEAAARRHDQLSAHCAVVGRLYTMRPSSECQ